MINVILSGANGHMGKVIASLAENDPDIRICAGFDINNMPGDGFPVYKNPFEYTGEADVIIDFSHPSAFQELTKYAKERKLPTIFATTGLSDEQKKDLHALAADIPVFFSANMSLGVNLLIDLVKRAAAALQGFDIEIIEKHHNRKIDAPSGTALAIADAISEVRQNSEYMYDRHSIRRKRSENEIGIHAVRGGTIVGEHDVLFAGLDEVIEIKHTAQSREIFAAGAIKAAKFLYNKPKGFYNMNDIINA